MMALLYAGLIVTGAAALFTGAYVFHPPLNLPDKHAYSCASTVRVLTRSPKSFQLVRYQTETITRSETGIERPQSSIQYYSMNAYGAPVLQEAKCRFEVGEPSLIQALDIGGQLATEPSVQALMESGLSALRFERAKNNSGPWKWMAWLKEIPALDIEPPDATGVIEIGSINHLKQLVASRTEAKASDARATATCDRIIAKRSKSSVEPATEAEIDIIKKCQEIWKRQLSEIGDRLP